MQTHLGMVPISVVALLIAGIGWSVRFRAGRSTRNRRDRVQPNATTPPPYAFPLVIGAVLVAFMWVGPVMQQISPSSHRGNITRILDFYWDPPRSATPRSHSLQDSITAVGDHVTTVLVGDVTDLVWPEGRLAGVAVPAVGGVLVGLLGWWRARFLAWLGILGTAGLFVAVVAGSRVIGPLYPYLFAWTDALGLPAIIAIVGFAWVAVSAPVHARIADTSRWRAVAAVIGVAAMLAGTGLVVRSVVDARTESTSTHLMRVSSRHTSRRSSVTTARGCSRCAWSRRSSRMARSSSSWPRPGTASGSRAR
jgi:hypothetical protein